VFGSRRPSASYAVSSREWRPHGAEAELIVRLVVRLVGFRLDQRASACQLLRHQLAGFSILEVDAARSHAHWVDAAQNEYAIVYHDLVADLHAADGGTRPLCSQLSFVETRHAAIARTSLWKPALVPLMAELLAPLRRSRGRRAPAQQAPLSHKSRASTRALWCASKAATPRTSRDRLRGERDHGPLEARPEHGPGRAQVVDDRLWGAEIRFTLRGGTHESVHRDGLVVRSASVPPL
jgi:hypothetical protein